MTQEEYAWMLGLISAWRQLHQRKSEEDEPFPGEMEEVTAIGGRLRHYEDESANEIAAALLIFLLIVWWLCAKSRAKFGVFHQEICKINELAFFSTIARNPHQMAAAGFHPSTLSGAKSITSPHPGKENMGFFMTVLLGIAGSLLAGAVGQFLGWYQAGEGAGFIASVIAAVGLLVIYGRLRQKNGGS